MHHQEGLLTKSVADKLLDDALFMKFGNASSVECLDSEITELLTALGLKPDNGDCVSIDVALRFFRKRYGLAINVIAHDGDYYTTEVVYLSNAIEEFQSRLDEDKKFADYEIAATEAIVVLAAELLEHRLKVVKEAPRLSQQERLKRLFDQIRRENFPKRTTK